MLPHRSLCRGGKNFGKAGWVKAYDFCLTDGSETLDDKKIISYFFYHMLIYARTLILVNLQSLIDDAKCYESVFEF